MPLEAYFKKEGWQRDYTAIAAKAGGEVVQLPDGIAGVIVGDIAAGALGSVRIAGQFSVAKTTSQVFLDGAPLWWDHSTNKAICVPPLSDKDYYLGTCVGDVAAAGTTCVVDINKQPSYIIDLHGSAGDVTPVLTAGAPFCFTRGASLEAGFSATAEAQKLDWLSKRSFPVNSNWILEAVVEVKTNSGADVTDLNIGVANGTHASDADAIAESAFFHFDMGADLNLDAESDDGTTEVAATDTTIDWAVGTPLHLVIDGRDHTDIQFFVNGVNVLPATVFTLAAATGPLKALFHMEKSSNAAVGTVRLDDLKVRIMEQ